MPTLEVESAAPRIDAWQQVVSLSRAMIDSARAGEIDRVIALEGQRHQLLDVVFSDNASRPSAAEIQQVMAMDAEIVSRAEVLRGDLQEKLSILSGRRKAVHAYTRCQP